MARALIWGTILPSVMSRLLAAHYPSEPDASARLVRGWCSLPVDVIVLAGRDGQYIAGAVDCVLDEHWFAGAEPL